MKMQLMNETLRYDITMKLYKKEKKLERTYLFHRKLRFQKFIKCSGY